MENVKHPPLLSPLMSWRLEHKAPLPWPSAPLLPSFVCPLHLSASSSRPLRDDRRDGTAHHFCFGRQTRVACFQDRGCSTGSQILENLGLEKRFPTTFYGQENFNIIARITLSPSQIQTKKKPPPILIHKKCRYICGEMWEGLPTSNSWFD